MFHVPFRKTSFPLGMLIAIVILSTGCQSKTPSSQPIILGAFPDIQSPMQDIFRYDPASKALVPIVEKATSLSYLESITNHNYTSVFSSDYRLMAVDVMDPEGYWDLDIFDLSLKDGKPVATAQIGTQLPKLHEGFSIDGHYYAFTYQNDQTGLLDVGVLDLENKGALITLPSAHFIDFSSDNQVFALTFDDKGSATGLDKFNPLTQKAVIVYQPATEVKLGVAILSPDQKWVIFTDLQAKTLDRVPTAGGKVEKIYQYTGNNTAVNYDRDGQFLIVMDLGTDQQILKLFSPEFKEIYSLTGIGTTTMNFSSDGQFFAYQLFGQKNMELYLTDFKAKTYFFIANSGILYKLGISPDNKYLAYLSVASNADYTGMLYLVRLKDLQSTKVDTNVSSFKFDTDSSLLFVKVDDTKGTSTLLRLSTDGATTTPLVTDAKGILFLVH